MTKPADSAATARATAATTPQSQNGPKTVKASQLNRTGGLQLQQPPTHSQVNSIDNLRKLSDAFSAFHRCFTELHQHVNCIKTSIDSLLAPNTNNTPPLPASSLPAAPKQEKEEEKGKGKEEECPNISELEKECQIMNSRDVKRYILSNLFDKTGLREQVPKALKLAPNPAKLAFDSCGKFFLQGSKAYVEGSPMVPAREASVFALECCLLMGIDDGVEIDKVLKEEVERAAISWRKRIVSEGGLANAGEMDARGLLLLIGCFGIPAEFTDGDILDLFRVVDVKEISAALRSSKVLTPKIPEIIERMLEDEMEVQAVDIAYTFGLEDRYNPTELLKKFLQRNREPATRSESSLFDLNGARRKQLSALRSVINCLKHNNIDMKFLHGFRLNEQLINLEKDIAASDKQIHKHVVRKRKNDATELSTTFSNNEVKRSRIPPLWTQRVAGSRHENIVGPQAGTVGGVATGGVGSVISAHVGTVQQGGRGGALVDPIPGQVGSHTGGWRDEAALYDRLASRNYAYRPSAYLEGSAGLSNTIPGDAYRPPPYLEGSTGLSNSIRSDIAGRSSASDIYQVADTAAALRGVDDVPSAHRSSYLYWPR